jgi:hypothetical protein
MKGREILPGREISDNKSTDHIVTGRWHRDGSREKEDLLGAKFKVM